MNFFISFLERHFTFNIPEYLTFSSTIFVIKEHGHYKHSDKEVRVLGIVKIG